MNRSRMLQRLLSMSSTSMPFVMTVQTNLLGTSNNDQFSIPTNSGAYAYDYNVDWGDGNSDSNVTGDITHTYASEGTYTIKITGLFPHIYFNLTGDSDKLLEIIDWGSIVWQSFERSFSGCGNLTSVDGQSINLSQVGSVRGMFRDCESITTLELTGWDTSQITDMYAFFRNCKSLLTLDVSEFDTSSVTDMGFMFIQCGSLTTLNVSGFDTSNVTNMGGMFRICLSLTDFDPSGFNIESVTNMSLFAIDTNMPTANYDATLINWEAQMVNNNLTPHFGDAQYTLGSAAATARQRLITDHSWSITDGGGI